MYAFSIYQKKEKKYAAIQKWTDMIIENTNIQFTNDNLYSMIRPLR